MGKKIDEETKRKIINLHKKGLTNLEISRLVGLSVTPIFNITKNLNLRNKKHWDNKEIEILRNEFGNTSLDKLSFKLQRTKVAIANKAYKLQLSSRYSNYLTTNDLAKVFNIHTSTVQQTWIKKYGLKYSKFSSIKSCSKRKIFKIDINDFWKFAKKNKKLIIFSGMDRYALGKEPSWVQDEIKREKESVIKKKKIKVWTINELEQLKKFWLEGYSIVEIAKKLNRTSSSIAHRRILLGLIPRTENRKVLETEKLEIKQMYERGYSYKKIAFEINRGEKNASRIIKILVDEGYMKKRKKKYQGDSNAKI